MKALVLFSGGVDSTTCLAMAVDKYGRENVIALSVSYGQKHKKEIQAAEKIANYYGVELKKLDLAKIFEGSDCSLLSSSDEDIPKESYAEQLEKTNGKPVSTYVPFRNGLFLSCAASVAISNGCTEIYHGIHMEVTAPFVNMRKSDIVAKGLNLNVPYRMTWSCYEGGEKPCGVCGTCRDRIAAFKANGITEVWE